MKFHRRTKLGPFCQLPRIRDEALVASWKDVTCLACLNRRASGVSVRELRAKWKKEKKVPGGGGSPVGDRTGEDP